MSAVPIADCLRKAQQPISTIFDTLILSMQLSNLLLCKLIYSYVGFSSLYAGWYFSNTVCLTLISMETIFLV